MIDATVFIVSLIALVVSPFALWAFAGHCDRIGREASAPLSRAYMILLAVALIVLFTLRALTGWGAE